MDASAQGYSNGSDVNASIVEHHPRLLELGEMNIDTISIAAVGECRGHYDFDRHFLDRPFDRSDRSLETGRGFLGRGTGFKFLDFAGV